MSIIWKYLDKRSAVVDALKDYGSMKFIIEHTDDEIRAAYEKMGGISSPQPDGMPHTHNPHAVEDRMVNGIEEIDVLKERYRQAMEYMAWFLPAWEHFPKMSGMCWKPFIRIRKARPMPCMTSVTASELSVLRRITKRTAPWGNW